MTERTEFTVSDTGVGIRVEDQAKLFQAFTQVDAPQGSARKEPAWVCTSAANWPNCSAAHITLAERVRKGSTFTLILGRGVTSERADPHRRRQSGKPGTDDLSPERFRAPVLPRRWPRGIEDGRPRDTRT